MRALFACVVFACSIAIQASVIWTSFIDGGLSDVDDARAVSGDRKGGCVVAGSIYLRSSGRYDGLVVHVGQFGQPVWKRQIDLPNKSLSLGSLSIDPVDGTIYAAGYASGQSGRTVVLAALGSVGNVLWTREWTAGSVYIFGETPQIELRADRSLLVGYMVAGDLAVRRLDRQGSEAWTATYDGSTHGEDQETDIAPTPDGGVVLVGNLGEMSKGYGIVKFNAAGQREWAVEDPGFIGNTLGPVFVKIAPGGDIVVAATPESSFGVPHYVISRYTSGGMQLWKQRYSDSFTADAQTTDLAVDSSGNAIVCGFRIGGSPSFVVVQYSPAGGRLWEQNYRSGGSSTAYGVAIGWDMNIYVTGFNLNGSHGGAVTVSYTPAGVLRWVEADNSGFSGQFSAIASDWRGVYAAGFGFTSNNNDFLVAKYPGGVSPWLWP